ncbi:hypothetical protein AJ88_11420 [Mesorhizobium amorphae CCBAU 01583]|nr:hypothetical protein AJ88_11420 [Mesorhizobium amorphae CCBAU 01583]
MIRASGFSCLGAPDVAAFRARRDEAGLDGPEKCDRIVEPAGVAAGGGRDGVAPFLAHQGVVVGPAPRSVDADAPAVFRIDMALDQPLAFQIAQHRGGIGALQPRRGRDLAGRGRGVRHQMAHNHALRLREQEHPLIPVATELDLAGNDEDQVGQIRPPNSRGRGFACG